MPDGGVGVVPVIPMSPHATTAKQATSAAKRRDAGSRGRMSRRIMLLSVEFGRRNVLGLLRGTRKHPQDIGHTIYVREQPLPERLAKRERDDPAFGTPQHRSAQLQRRGRTRLTRYAELARHLNSGLPFRELRLDRFEHLP